MDSNGNMESRLLPLLSDTSIRWRAGIQAIDLPTRVLAVDAVVVRLRVRNAGEIRWPSALEQTTRPVRVYGRMQPASGRSAGQPFLVGAMPRCVAPGETVDLEMIGFAGGNLGHGRVKIDLLLGERWWFEELGSEPLMLDFEIGDAGSRPPLLELISSPSTIRGSDAFEVVVRVHDRLNSPLDGSMAAMHCSGVGIRWVSGEADVHLVEGPRCYFKPPLSSGEVREFRLSVPAGSLTPGRWSGKLDFIQEGLTWLETLGLEPLRPDLAVNGGLEPCRAANTALAKSGGTG